MECSSVCVIYEVREWTGSVGIWHILLFVFFFQAEDGIRDIGVTGVQTCALPILQSFETNTECQIKSELALQLLLPIKTISACILRVSGAGRWAKLPGIGGHGKHL